VNDAHLHVKGELTKALRALGVDSPRVILEKPRDAQHGDIATNVAMTHAKDLRKPPRDLAEELLKRLVLDRKQIASENIAGPGFINFVMADEFLRSITAQALTEQERFGSSHDLASVQVLIEFVSANPSGPLNIVSARAAAVGDTLVRMFRKRGAKCYAEFYVNDAGNQVRLLGESVRARYESEMGFPAEIPEGGYHGDYIVEFARDLIKEFGDRFHQMPAEQAAQELGQRAVEHHVAQQKASLERFRVAFDNWFRESTLREKRAEFAILERLKGRDAVYEKDGALYLRTSDFGDTQDWVVVTKDGRPTYFLPDIAYHLNKFERGYDHIVDVLGPDHHSFIAKMSAGLRALGLDAAKLEVILLQHVTLLRDGEPIKMSKRAGKLIEMDELLDEVGTDAARYFFLLRRTSTPLDFDIDLAKKQSDENPVYYVQYAHARIESIFRKGDVPYPEGDVDLTPLTAPEELTLLRRVREFGDVLEETTSARDPHLITVWLREVAAQFHKFYQECRVLTEPAELQQARLALCRATQIALRNGLALCGVEAPREM
jgi:arginyl-tRNA synthetase